MILRTSAIALAVAGIVAAPMAAQAESGFYASARVGLTYTDSKSSGPTATTPPVLGGGPSNPHDHVADAPPAGTDTSNMNIGSRSSRFGFKGETDLGNGLTGLGHYELGIDESSVSVRHLWVGTRADWGTVKLGKTYMAMYNFVEGPVDWCNISCGTGALGTNSRTSNAIEYSRSGDTFQWAAVWMADGTVVNGSDEGQGFQLAGNFAVGGVNLALGIESRDINAPGVPGGTGTDDVIGGTVHGTAGDFYYALMFETNEVSDGIVAVVDWSGFYAMYGIQDFDDPAGGGVSADPSYFTIGYNQSIGRNTTAYYEYSAQDADTGNSNDDTTLFHATLKYAWK